MKYIISLILTFLIVANSLAQKNIDSINILKAEQLISKCLTNIGSSDFLLYSIEDDYITVVKKNKNFKLYYLRSDSCIIDSLLIGSNDAILNRSFKESACSNRFVYSSSDSTSKYAQAHSKYVYFRFWRKGVKYCEFNLPILFYTDVSKKRIYPISDELHDYLFSKLIYYSQIIHGSHPQDGPKK